MEFFEFKYVCFAQIRDINLPKGFIIHFVRLYQIGVTPIDNAVVQNAKTGSRNVEIAVQLRVVNIQPFPPMLAFNDNDELPIFLNALVYFFAFFYTQVHYEFKNDLKRVENVVAHRCNEGHHEGIFSSFLG